MLVLAVLSFVVMQSAISEVGDPILTGLINLGVAGIILWWWTKGTLVSGREVAAREKAWDREREYLILENRDLKQGLREAQATLSGQALPAITHSAQALESIPAAGLIVAAQLQDAQERIVELTAQVQRLSRDR